MLAWGICPESPSPRTPTQPGGFALKRALVTGAYGFVGRHVARALAREGFAVRGIGHGAWSRDEARLWGVSDWRIADVAIESLTADGGEPDVIVHCAGSGSVGFSMSHPDQDFQRTVATTHAVLEYARTVCPGAAIVIPSSAGVYGVAQTMPIAVGDRLDPVSPYGVHKKMAEDQCRAYGRHFGLRVALVRLFSIYGIGLRKQLMWDACGKIARDDLVFSGTGAETRDWLHVEDAADLLIEAAGHACAECPVVNGGTGEATPISAVVGALAAQLGARAAPRFSGVSRPGDPAHYQAEISGARAWGWAPKRGWRDGVRAYAAWFAQGAG